MFAVNRNSLSFEIILLTVDSAPKLKTLIVCQNSRLVRETYINNSLRVCQGYSIIF